MKKIMKKASPFKEITNGEDKKEQQKNTSVIKGSKGGYSSMITQTKSSAAAGNKLVGKVAQTPPAPKNKTITVPNRGSAGFNKAFAGAKEGSTFNYNGKSYVKKTSKTGATKKITVPDTSEPTAPTTPAPNTQGYDNDTADNSFTDLNETQKQGLTAPDVRGDFRKIKVATRESANAAKNIVKFEEKASKTTNKKRQAKFLAKAEGNKTKKFYADEVLGHAEEAARQGSAGNRLVTTVKDISNARITAESKGLLEGGKSTTTSTSSSNNGFVAPADKVEEKLNLKSSVFKMLKPGTFKMAGFGNKNKK